MRKIHFKSSGFSLIEVMISVGIISGLALIIANLMNVQVGIKKSGDVDEEILNLSSMIISFINDKDSCSSGLKRVVINSTSKWSTTNIASLTTSNGSVIIQKNQAFKNSELFVTDIRIDTNIDDPFLAASRYHLYQAHLVIDLEKRYKGDSKIQPPGVKNIQKRYNLLLDYSLHQPYTLYTQLSDSESYIKELIFNQCKTQFPGANYVGHDVYHIFCNNKDMLSYTNQKLCAGICQVKNTSDIQITRCL